MSELNIVTPVPIEELKQRRIGRILTKMGRVSRETVQAALVAQQGEQKGKKLGQILVEAGNISQADLDVALAGQYGFQYVDLEGVEFPPEGAGHSNLPRQQYKVVRWSMNRRTGDRYRHENRDNFTRH